jgi:hypothetical protein
MPGIWNGPTSRDFNDTNIVIFSFKVFRGYEFARSLETLLVTFALPLDESRRSVSDFADGVWENFCRCHVPWDSYDDRETSTGSAFLLQKSQGGKQFNQQQMDVDNADLAEQSALI